MDEAANDSPTETQELSNEVKIIRIALELWDHRKWIAIGTSVTMLVGLVYALFIMTPMYDSSAIISPKSSDQLSGGLSTAFARFNSLSAGPGIYNNTIAMFEILLKGHELTEDVITKHDLLPVLFPKKWNPETKSWKSSNPKKIPTLRAGSKLLLGKMLNVSVELKRNLVNVEVHAPDTLLAKRLVEFYLSALNERIRYNVMRTADSDRVYLQRQLNIATDPAVIEKLQGMIAGQIEKSMLVSSQSFDLLEGPVVPLRGHPSKRVIMMISILAGMFISSIAVYVRKPFLTLQKTFAREKATLKNESAG